MCDMYLMLSLEAGTLDIGWKFDCKKNCAVLFSWKHIDEKGIDLVCKEKLGGNQALKLLLPSKNWITNNDIIE